MVRQGAPEAETVAAAAADGRHDMVELGGRDVAFDGVFTVWCGTPFKVVVIVDISSVEQCHVSDVNEEV